MEEGERLEQRFVRDEGDMGEGRCERYERDESEEGRKVVGAGCGSSAKGSGRGREGRRVERAAKGQRVKRTVQAPGATRQKVSRDKKEQKSVWRIIIPRHTRIGTFPSCLSMLVSAQKTFAEHIQCRFRKGTSFPHLKNYV